MYLYLCIWVFVFVHQSGGKTYPDQQKYKDKENDNSNGNVNPRDVGPLRQLQFWRLGIWIHDNHCKLTIKERHLTAFAILAMFYNGHMLKGHMLCSFKRYKSLFPSKDYLKLCIQILMNHLLNLPWPIEIQRQFVPKRFRDFFKRTSWLFLSLL